MAVQPLASQVGVAPACRALGVPRASFYRRQRPAPGHQQPRPTPARALCASERAHVLDVLASPRFVDRSPAEVVATLLDEGQYLCAERTMYRILAANQPVRERRNQRSHPCYTKPELVATGPNQTWSWDITRLRGPKRWTSFYLYVLLDIFSRCVVGWMVADRENAALAATLIEETCLKQGIEPQVLTLHSDRGAPMTSKCTAQLLADLGVTRYVLLLDHDIAEVNADAELKTPVLRLVLVAPAEIVLNLCGARDGVGDRGEFGQERVAGRADHAAAAPLDVGRHGGPVFGERPQSNLLVGAHEARISRDVGGEDGRESARNGFGFHERTVVDTVTSGVPNHPSPLPAPDALTQPSASLGSSGTKTGPRTIPRYASDNAEVRSVSLAGRSARSPRADVRRVSPPDSAPVRLVSAVLRIPVGP